MESENVFNQKQESRWLNKQRTLVVPSRGITERHRHLMLDIINLLPHHKKEAKIEKKDIPSQIQELCYIHSCTNFLYFETRKNTDLYLWIGRFPSGPSIKFLVENIHTSKEMNLTGNCLKFSRHILSFDQEFKQDDNLKLIREVLTHAFNVPNMHPKAKPVIDHALSFTHSDKKIWFRNYQIFYESQNKVLTNHELYEMGPRFVLNPICVLDGTMQGIVLFKNETYLTKAKIKSQLRKQRQNLQQSKEQKKIKLDNVKNIELENDDVDDIFQGNDEDYE